MKAHLIAVVVLVCASMLWAQSTTPQTPPAGTANSSQKTSNPHAGKGMGMADMKAMHAQHMEQMKADMQKMQALLDQMKSSISGMDAKDQPAMQANAQMWEMMVDHLNKMMQHMSEMPGKGGMHRRHHDRMHGGPPPSSGTGTAPSTATPPK